MAASKCNKLGRPETVVFPGSQFGRWTSLYKLEERHRGYVMWMCQCTCGTLRAVKASNLVSGHCKSCGCLQKENAAHLKYSHGQAGTHEHQVWNALKSRCYNKSSEKYPIYGGRGIVVCDGWRNNFYQFYLDMGKCPHGFSIDRINNNGHYSCGKCPQCIANNWNMNCRWATDKTQQNNKNNNHLLTYNGITKTLGQWADDTGLLRTAIYARLKRGWSVERAITEPLRFSCKRSFSATQSSMDSRRLEDPSKTSTSIENLQ